MNKYKSLIASSLLIATVLIAPSFSFADNGNHNGNDQKTIATHTSMKVAKNNSNSFWSKIEGFFGQKASAAAPTAPVSTTSKVNIAGITAPTVLKTGAEGTWTVRASDSQNNSLSYAVDWGDTAAPGMLKAMTAPVFVQDATFTHTYSNPGTYTVKFTVENTAGTQNTSSVTVHIIGSPIPASPVISGFTATSTKPHQATVAWTTDVPASSLVWYSTTAGVDTSGTATVSRAAKVTNHSIVLTSLDPNTTYYVMIGSANAGGTTKSSAEISFTTAAVVNKNAPVITSVDGDKTVAAGDTETVTVNAQDPKNGSLTYTADWGDSAGMSMLARPSDVFTQTSTFTHVYDTAGTYTATFTAQNDQGLKATSSIDITVTPSTTPVDTTAPVIAAHDDMTVEATSNAGAVVTYTAPTASDNVDADASATCLPASGSTFAFGDTKVLCDHSDAAGNAATETSFTVSVVDTTAPVIASQQDITVAATSASGAVVTYTAPNVTDNYDMTTSATCAPASGSTFPVGATPVTCNHTDTNGNVATATTFTVNVTPQSTTESSR